MKKVDVESTHGRALREHSLLHCCRRSIRSTLDPLVRSTVCGFDPQFGFADRGETGFDVEPSSELGHVRVFTKAALDACKAHS